MKAKKDIKETLINKYLSNTEFNSKELGKVYDYLYDKNDFTKVIFFILFNGYQISDYKKIIKQNAEYLNVNPRKLRKRLKKLIKTLETERDILKERIIDSNKVSEIIENKYYVGRYNQIKNDIKKIKQIL